MSTRCRVALRHLVVCAVLLVAVLWLVQIGHGPLATPSLSIRGLRVWVDERDPVMLTLAVVRLEALVFASYLLVLTALRGLAQWLALPRAARLIDRMTVPALRGMLGGAAALGLIAVPPSLPQSPHTMPLQVAPDSPSPDDAHATLHLLPAAEPAPASKAETVDNTWVVQPGDSLWSIASDHLVDTGGPVDDAAIAVMWRRIIDLNRNRLVVPDDPDLIFANQVFELPAADAG